jgi:sarcosine oxidase, subunit gamma
MVEMFQSALSHRSEPKTTSIAMREISERGMIDLRGLASDRRFTAAAKSVLGVDFPKAARTSTSWGDIKILWLSIDQWLITCPRDKADALHAQLVKALEGIHSLAVNVSDMRAIIRLEGEGVRETLMKGTSLDLTEGYAPGSVRRMRFAEIAALLNVVEDNVIDVYVFRSYAEYTWEFLLKGARKGSEVKLFRND